MPERAPQREQRHHQSQRLAELFSGVSHARRLSTRTGFFHMMIARPIGEEEQILVRHLEFPLCLDSQSLIHELFRFFVHP
jgi:hypothetical protein